jgi:hypothetical protein
MADTPAPVVHIGENSPEKVAFDLMRVVIHIDNKQVSGISGKGDPTDRKWILDTYAECLNAVKGYRT